MTGAIHQEYTHSQLQAFPFAMKREEPGNKILKFVVILVYIPTHCSLSLLQREIVTSWRGLGFLRSVAKSGYFLPYRMLYTMHNMDACWSVCASVAYTVYKVLHVG